MEVALAGVELRLVRLPLAEPFATPHGTRRRARRGRRPGPGRRRARRLGRVRGRARAHLLARVHGRRARRAASTTWCPACSTAARCARCGATRWPRPRWSARRSTPACGPRAGRWPRSWAPPATGRAHRHRPRPAPRTRRRPGRRRAAAGTGQGHRAFKIKIQPGWDVEPLRAVRERAWATRWPCWPTPTAATAATPSTTLATLGRLADADIGLVALEQPFAPDDLVGHARLARRDRRCPCASTSRSARSAELESALTLEACGAVSLKAGRVGGLDRGARGSTSGAATPACRCGAAACSRPASAGPSTWRSPRCPGCNLPPDLGPSARYFADRPHGAVRVGGWHHDRARRAGPRRRARCPRSSTT